MKIKTVLSALVLAVAPLLVFAAGAKVDNLGGVAERISTSLAGVKNLIVVIATIAGLGFGVAAIFKFKQHRDNPQQVPLGQPLSLLAISVMLLWLPFLLQSAGATLTGNTTTSTVGNVPDWMKGGDGNNNP